MRVLYVYCHPLPESFHAAIRAAAWPGSRPPGTRSICSTSMRNLSIPCSLRRAGGATMTRRATEAASKQYPAPDLGRGDRDAIPDLVLRDAGDDEGVLR